MPRLFNSVPIKKSGASFFLKKTSGICLAHLAFKVTILALKTGWRAAIPPAFIVLSDDRIAFEEYYLGNSAKSLAIGWSLSKSLMSLLIEMAVDEGSIHSLLDPVNLYAPQLSAGGYAGVSLRCA